ncbi:MAG: peptidase M16 [Pelagibacteraceae bacterium]|nr:peptidase M16 [Pelagibacteraceae bacterium]|tara:strand:- start:1023 stop:2276 length:1254 start_codon:yes stop_codon:yes gene_type:complete
MPNTKKLSNGITLITDFVDTVETISVGMWIKVGARNENDNNNGVAHLLEHMAFKGTKNRTALEIAQEVEMIGGHVNAYTSREITAYYMKVLKEDIKTSVDIISDILQFSSFDKKELDRERGVILQEIGMYLDTPDDLVFDKWQETAYPNQPMGRSILGKTEIIKNIQREEVSGFMNDFYNPEKMVFSVSGNFNEKEVIGLVEEKFNFLPKGTSNYSPKSNYEGGDFRQNKELEQVNLILGFKGVDYFSDLYYATALYSTVLGSGMSSRLFQEIREKRGLVYSISSYSSSFTDSGVFGIYAGTGSEEIKELIPVLCDQLNIHTSSFTPDELKRAKAQFKSSLLMGKESTSVRARSNATQKLLYNRIIDDEERMKKINAITLEDLEKARLNIIQSPLTISAIGPIKNLDSHNKILKRFN